MLKRPSLFISLAIFAFLFLCAMPSIARAQSAQDACADGQVNQGLQSTLAQAGQQKIQAMRGIQGQYGTLDIKAQYCWTQIQTAFTALGAMSGGPLGAVAWAAVQGIVNNLINQVCQMVMQSINQLKQFLVSQLNHICLPMPNLNMGSGGMMGMGGLASQPGSSGQCSGGSMFSSSGSTSQQALPVFNSSNMFGGGH